VSYTWFGENDGKTWGSLLYTPTTGTAATAISSGISLLTKSLSSSSSTASSPASTPSAAASGGGGGGASTGAIVGGVVGGLAVLAIAVLGIVFLLIRNRKHKAAAAEAAAAAAAGGAGGAPGGVASPHYPGGSPGVGGAGLAHYDPNQHHYDPNVQHYDPNNPHYSYIPQQQPMAMAGNVPPDYYKDPRYSSIAPTDGSSPQGPSPSSGYVQPGQHYYPQQHIVSELDSGPAQHTPISSASPTGTAANPSELGGTH
jgi:hypothetical protein